MTPEEKLVAVADQFAALIASDPWIASPSPLTVVTERAGDINAIIQAAIAKTGLCITVVAPDGETLAPQRSGPQGVVLRVRLVAQIDENAVLNRAAAESSGSPYRSALGAAGAIMRAVHRQPNGLDPLVTRNGAPVAEHRPGLNEFVLAEQPFRLVPARTTVTYHVTAYTTFEL